MRVLHIQSFPRWIRDLFQAEFTASGIDVVWSEDISDGSWDAFADVEVILTSKQHIGKEMMSSFANLALIQVQGRAPWAVDWAAAKEVGIRLPVVVRLQGTNAEEGRAILARSGLDITSAETLQEAGERAVAAVSGAATGA